MASIQSFLTDPTQQVKLPGALSTKRFCPASVPQGSVISHHNHYYWSNDFYSDMFYLDFDSLLSIIDLESLEMKTVQLVKLKIQEIKRHIFLLTQLIGNRTMHSADLKSLP